MLTKIKDDLLRRIQDNPVEGVAWMLAGFLVFSVYSNHQIGKELTQVCETVANLGDGYIDLETLKQFRATGIDWDALMVDAERVQMLLKADTAEGRAYRWWHGNSTYIVDLCSERLAEDYEDGYEDDWWG